VRNNTSSPPTQSPAAAAARARFLVILEGAAGADTAHAHTLRHLLKYLLRSRSLRCVEARQLTEEGSSS
jgi:hypothetical protein